MIVANDATVKGGTYYPMTVKKHLRAQEIALENRLPCVYLVDSGGAFLPLQADVFPDREHFGRIFYNQARMSAAGIPQVALVMGSSTAGGAYVPAMSDETVIVKGTGTIFLGGPPLVKAATGEEVSRGGPRRRARSIRASPASPTTRRSTTSTRSRSAGRSSRHLERKPPAPPWDRREPEPPAVDPAAATAPPTSTPRSRPTRAVRRRFASSSPASSTARASTTSSRCYGETLVCGFAHSTAGPSRSSPTTGSCSASRRSRAPTSSSSRCQRKIPLVFLQNITGFMVGREYEAGGIAKDGAKLVTAVACAEVPKFTVLIGGSFGAGNYAMAGRAYQPRFLWTWPNARISRHGRPQAARVLSTVRRRRSPDDAERDAFEAPILETYEREGSPYFATARLWDDGVIDPLDTRRVLSLGIEAALHAPDPGDAVRRLPDVDLARGRRVRPVRFYLPGRRPWSRWSEPAADGARSSPSSGHGSLCSASGRPRVPAELRPERRAADRLRLGSRGSVPIGISALLVGARSLVASAGSSSIYHSHARPARSAVGPLAAAMR